MKGCLEMLTLAVMLKYRLGIDRRLQKHVGSVCGVGSLLFPAGVSVEFAENTARDSKN